MYSRLFLRHDFIFGLWFDFILSCWSAKPIYVLFYGYLKYLLQKIEGRPRLYVSVNAQVVAKFTRISQRSQYKQPNLSLSEIQYASQIAFGFYNLYFSSYQL